MVVGSRRSRACMAAALAAWLGICGLVACGGEVARPERRHADLESFARTEPEGTQHRVALIGIDGASWEYLRPLLAAGELPNLARLFEGGTTATLRSIECHFTPPAWTTMLTGQPPERTGVYSFGRWDAEAQRFAQVSSRDVHVPAVWDVAGRAGRRVSVIGVPATYPPYAVNGELVSGLMTPKTRLPPLTLARAPDRRRPDPSLQSHSPLLSAALDDEYNVFLPTLLDTIDDGETRYDQVDLRVLRKGIGTVARRTLDRQRFPVGEFSPWVRVRLGAGPSARSGFLKLRFDAPEGEGLKYVLTPTFLRTPYPFTHPLELSRELYQRFGYYLPHEFLSVGVLDAVAREAADHARHFVRKDDWDLFLYVFGQSDNAHHLIGFGEEALPIYRTIDTFLGELLDERGQDTTLVIASDHGFGSFDHAVDLNQFLAEQGLLHWKERGVVDHDRSLVFHNLWHLHFNPDRLDAESLAAAGVSVAEGQTPRDALAGHVIRLAGELRAADGEPFPVRLVRLPPDAVGAAPDLAVQAHDAFWVEFWNIDRPSGEVVRPLVGDERWKHARDGILAVHGPGVRRGHDLGVVEIAQVAPTLLDLMGLPVADDLAGPPLAVLEEARPLHRVASYGALDRAPSDAPADPADFEETLKALGYVRD